MLRLVELFQREDYQSVFDLDDPGFNTGWWGDRLSKIVDVHEDRFSLFEGDEELGRAEIEPRYRLADRYVGLATPRDVVNIEFIEVRTDRQCGGFGSAFVELLVERYAGHDLIAFSEQADRFWTKVGWEHHPRTDRRPMYRPLFVHLAS